MNRPASELQELVERHFEARASLSPDHAPRELMTALDECLALLGSGRARVAEPADGGWRVNEWLRKAVLLHFRTHDNAIVEAGALRFFDKLPLKYRGYTDADFRAEGARVVPGAIVRAGAHVARDAVLMPCFVNVGAWIGAGSMVDTWATVGSCAQIGRNVHLSGGVGIGGVLEPLQARPTIIEDDCFIGARSEVVEGVIIERGAVLSMGVFLGASTRIYDRESRTVTYGRVPAGSVVVPGSLPAADGSHSLYCAVIVKKVDAQTRAKTSINELLRGA
ncbi:MAG TPA: 2,3,4,5-tetrahydropyridine-2,6-dicarboxylate N-succinyltransferase [Steroidobacteraceae bacterium]|nr:2,3,4,5-tetrahydropyridine-2,6-dicarboxylate N-succinyltransferase [Steroidobacteraceae bacterium]